jgi:hypothetical protein
VSASDAAFASLTLTSSCRENENIPKVNVTPAAVVFNNTPFDQAMVQKIKIENTGQVSSLPNFLSVRASD